MAVRALGDVRLLRHADRLERRHPPRARAALRRRRGPASCCTRYHEVEPRDPGRGSDAELPRGDGRRARAARRAGRRGGRARPLAAGVGRRSRRCRRRSRRRAPRGWRLAILSNTDRDFIDASIARIGVAVRARDRRLRDRLVQAGARPLGGVLRADRRRPRAARPRRREPLPRHRARATSSGCAPSGSTGSARSPSRQPDARAAQTWPGSPQTPRRARRARERPARDARGRGRDRRAVRLGRGDAAQGRPSGLDANAVHGWWQTIDLRARTPGSSRRTGRSWPQRSRMLHGARGNCGGTVRPSARRAAGSARGCSSSCEGRLRRGRRARGSTRGRSPATSGPASCSSSAATARSAASGRWRSSSTASRPSRAARDRDVPDEEDAAGVPRRARGGVRGSLGAASRAVRGVVEAAACRARTSTRRSGSSIRDGDEIAAVVRNELRDRRPARSARSASAGPGGAAATAARSCSSTLPRVPAARLDAGRRSASTPRTRPARRSSTRASACTSSTRTIVWEKALA